MKVCSNPDCLLAGTLQPWSAFHASITSRTGHKCRCKACLSIDRRRYRAKVNARKAEVIPVVVVNVKPDEVKTMWKHLQSAWQRRPWNVRARA